MEDWIKWAEGDASDIAEALRKDWRDRGALTAEEAFGEPDNEVSVNKGIARAHKDGAMSRFASEATMRHLKTVGLIEGLKCRNVKPTGETERGMMRLWPVEEALKAETALVIADYADLPARRVARLLCELPFTDHKGKRLIDSYAESWASHAFSTLGLEAEDEETQQVAQEYFRSNPEAAPDAPRERDPKLIIADRQWIFAVNLSNAGHDHEPFYIGEIKAFRTGAYSVSFIPAFKDPVEVAFASMSASEHRPDSSHRLLQAAVVSELNLFEPMRRFIHRNRKEGEQ